MIYTFYSFKGGVGRSMALSNVAEFLYSRGARVLMIDWDLEAPGLESFFFGPDDAGALDVRSRVGLIDYLDQYRRDYDALRPRATFETVQEGLRAPEKLLVPIHPPAANNTGGELWLLPAGWRASRRTPKEGELPFDDRFPKYAATVQDFNWSEFYTNYEGEAFFNWFRERLINGAPAATGTSTDGSRQGFDAILIDSRTGVTEVGGVCTRQLADVVVSFCAPNYQNLAGAERMSESFSQPKIMEARGNRPLEVVVIPARVDEAGETDAQNIFRREFVRKIKTPAALKESISSSWQLLVPYVTKYAYRESLAVSSENSNEKLEQAYKKLAAHLVLLSPLGNRLRLCLSSEIQALRRSRPRTFILLADPGADVALEITRNPGVEAAASITEAGSLVVSFSQATLTAEVKQHIRNARQRGVCVYGLRKGGPTVSVPAILRNSAIHESGQPLDDLLDQLRTPCQVRRAPFMCPSLTPGWVPRNDDLGRLRAVFLKAETNHSRPVAAIRGPAGFGATTLAAGLCYDESILNKFIDGILWVTPGQGGDVLGCLNAIGTALSGTSSKFENVGEATARLGQQLAGSECLLVVDEVVREEDLNPFRTLPVAILATARQSVPIKDATEVTLDRMSHEQAVQMLALGRTVATGDGLARLAYRLGHWPLALALAKAPLSQLAAKGMDSDAAAAALARDLEAGDVSAFGSAGPVLLKEARQQIVEAVASLPEADRDFFHSLKSLVDTPSFPLDSFPGRWTAGEQRFSSAVQTLQRAGLIALDPQLLTVELSAVAIQYLRELRAAPESHTAVFVLRPFGLKNNIDFDLVERELIVPGLQELGIRSHTSEDLIDAGNIRPDSLTRLLAADLVIADVSLANWNVAYQLGIRHALRDKRTLLLRAANVLGSEIPFDLRTDRYASYDARHPAQTRNAFVSAVRGVLDSNAADSPLFAALPNLVPVSMEQVAAAPAQFRDDVHAAEAARSSANLRLFSVEVRALPWAIEGLRIIGRSQFKLRAFRGAAETWEEVRRADPADKEANLLLGTIYRQLNDLAASDAALQRVTGRPDVSEAEQAEAFGLLARNLKTRWHSEWRAAQNPRETAVRSPLLGASIRYYSQALEGDPRSHYAALNALSLLFILGTLAKAQPESWTGLFETDEEAHAETLRLERERALMAAAAELALRQAERYSRDDIWVKLGRADLTLYTAAKGSRAVATYRQALAGAPPFVVSSAVAQLELLKDLGVLSESVEAILGTLPETTASFDAQPGTTGPPTALLFAGHAVDDPRRTGPRFPAALLPAVRQKIKESIHSAQLASPNLIGIAGASAGSDILFHEVCLELGVPTMICLPYPAEDYVASSVQFAGSEWVGRFFRLMQSRGENVRVLANTAELPSWLGTQREYSVWQRNLNWFLASGTEEGSGGVRLLAVWDGREHAGYGGVSDFVHQAQARGIPAEILFMDDIAAPASVQS